MEFEFSILYALQGLHHPWLDSLMTGVSSLADHGRAFIFLGLVLFCIKRTRKLGAAILISIVIGFFLGNVVLKNLFARSRPCWIDESIILLVKNPRDFSFPSGHTLIAFEAAASIWLVHRRWGSAALFLAVLIGFSRMYLFVHFPTDVLGGMVLGTGIAVFVKRVLLEQYEKKAKKRYLAGSRNRNG